jgi:hypothetical protein
VRQWFRDCYALPRGRASWVGANSAALLDPPVEISGTIPAVAAFADYGPTPAEQTKMIAKTRAVVLEAPVASERTIPAPKLGREGRREIGRALGAMYDDVLRQGVPPRIVELLDGLDALAHGNLGSGRVG